MPRGSKTRNQAARVAQAATTRSRIIAAATRLFETTGYLETTMADIAREANVAVQTLYLKFGSKVALLTESLDVAIVGDDEPVPIVERPWFVSCLREPNGAIAIGQFVDGAGTVIARHHALFAAVKTAAADPEVAALLATNKTQRFEVHKTFARSLVSKSGMRANGTVRDVAASVYTLVSPESYGLLVVERGWAKKRWADWASRHLTAEFLKCE